MTQEAYCSFEVAKLLKEKGFDCSCHATYDTAVTGGKPQFYEYEVLNYFPYGMKNSDDKYGMVISAPTHQMAMKWLREAHNIDIEVHAEVGMLGVKVYIPFISRYNSFTEHPSKLRQYKNGLYFEDDRGVIPAIKHFETYEQACEAAIKYCLENLI